ncbi:MAG: RsmB/NOP family class I SAM-dependent RNA methyltransferase [Bdellovibrionia bacterium]
MMNEKQSHFDDYYSKIYGERWSDIKSALLIREKQVARVNLFATVPQHNSFSQHSFLPELVDCFWQTTPPYLPQRAENDLLDVYVMDPGSVFVARALEVQEGDRVLDMCAAPGGKTLILAQALREQGELLANDLSPERRERLKKVMQQYVPREIRERFWIRGQDGVQFGLKEPESFDRILLDAPCSGERHLLENEKALKEWSPRRSEHLATRQYALLSAAWLALKPGGRLVYSTCTISPQENDQVIAKLLKKKKEMVEVVDVPVPFSGAEKTEHGISFMPDKVGFGPLYYSVLIKSEK